MASQRPKRPSGRSACQNPHRLNAADNLGPNGRRRSGLLVQVHEHMVSCHRYDRGESTRPGTTRETSSGQDLDPGCDTRTPKRAVGRPAPKTTCGAWGAGIGHLLCLQGALHPRLIGHSSQRSVGREGAPCCLSELRESECRTAPATGRQPLPAKRFAFCAARRCPTSRRGTRSPQGSQPFAVSLCQDTTEIAIRLARLSRGHPKHH